MNADPESKVVVVTGASRGIGKGLAVGLAALGASVVCAARSEVASPGGLPGTIHDTAREIEAAGGTALAVRCDIGEASDIAHLVDEVMGRFGRFDALVNNAMAPTRSMFAESSVQEWDESMRVNVRSLYLFTRTVAPHMTGGGGGSIVNISSAGAAHETTPFMPPGYLFYSVAKAALERFTSAVAPELVPFGITINALRPGAVRTEMTALEFGPDADWTGWSTPDAVVAPVAALAFGPDFTGRVLDVSGFGHSWP